MPAIDASHADAGPNSEREASMLYDIESRFDSQGGGVARQSIAAGRSACQARARGSMKALNPLLPLMFADTSIAIGDRRRRLRRQSRPHENSGPTTPSRRRCIEAWRAHLAIRPEGLHGTGHGEDATLPEIPRAREAGGYGHEGRGQLRRLRRGCGDAVDLGGVGEEGAGSSIIAATSDSHAHYADESRSGTRTSGLVNIEKTSGTWPAEPGGVLDGDCAADGCSPSPATSSRGLTSRPARATAWPASARRFPFRRAAARPGGEFRDPDAKNTHGDNPRVARVNVIMGEIHGPSEDANADRNQTTRVIARVVEKQWKRDGDTYSFTTPLPQGDRSFYIRIRGTNTEDLEPPMDAIGESLAQPMVLLQPDLVEVDHPSTSLPHIDLIPPAYPLIPTPPPPPYPVLPPTP